MIQDVNFLPAKYRQMRESRRQKLWRRSALLVFLALIAAGAVQQRQMRSRLLQNRDQMRADAERMLSMLENPQSLRDAAARLDGQANVLAFLRVRVPPTCILSSITNALPRFVALTEFEMKYEPLPAAPQPSGRAAPAAAAPASATENLSPWEKDLAALQKEARENALFVTVGGIAPHDMAIAAYLAALHRTGVFAEVVLLYTDQHTLEESNVRRFGARLRVHQPFSREVAEPSATTPDAKSGVSARKSRTEERIRA